ncbi:hypothetical protein E2320_010008 [Naja naja]|nr:hypothetical protein E2320_010008 [Naja naja]
MISGFSRIIYQMKTFGRILGTCHRISFQTDPLHGGTNTIQSKRGRGNFQNQSSSPFSINVPPKKTFEKVKEQPEDSKEFKQDKGNTATSVKEDVPSKVKPKDSQPDEDSPSQTASIVSPETVAEEESPSGIIKIPLYTQNEDIVLQLQDKLKDCEATEDLLSQTVSILSPGISTEDKTSSCSTEVFQNIEEKDSILQLQDKLKDCEATEDLLSQTVSILSPGISTEDKTSSCSTEVFQNIEEKDSILQLQDKLKDCEATEDLLSQTVSILSPGISTEDKTSSCSTEVFQNIEEKDSILQQASQSAQDSSHGFSTTAVEIPFLSENANDDQCERREEIELTEISTKQQNDTDDCQAYVVAPALDSSSLSSILSDIPFEAVLVREKDTGLTETSAKQNGTDDSQAYVVAPALDSSSLPSTLNDIPCEHVLLREKDTGLSETSAKQQNDTDDSQAYVVAPALGSSSLPSTLNDIPFEPTEISANHQNDTDDSQAYVVAPALDSSSLPSTLNDIPFEPVLVREKDTGLTEISAKQNGTDDSQAYVVAPALDSSSLPSTLNDFPCEPVLLREKDTGLTETSAKQNGTDDSQAYVVAPALDSSSLPSTLNDICYVPVLVRRKVIELVSTSISSNGNHNIESLVKSKSSSPKIHYSINSKHSSTNQTSRDLRCQSTKSYVRQECSSRSSGKRELSTERQDRSSKLSCRREPSSGSSHKEVSPQREKHTSKSPYRQEQSSQKWDHGPKTSLMQEHGVKSMHKRKCSSSSPPKKKRTSKSQKLDRWKEKKSGRSCCCHCNYHCQQSCSPFPESLWHRYCSPSYLACKIEHLSVSKEMGNVYGMPYHLSPERSIENKKEIRESGQVVEPKIPVIEKKKRATLRAGRKPLKSSTKKDKTSSPCHLNAEEETNSSVPSWTPKDRSAAVLARKEELEQAYLQVLLNFGVIAIMLVEKEPCMIEAMSSALRANLRKIGDYYECLLKNYIDSLAEAS